MLASMSCLRLDDFVWQTLQGHDPGVQQLPQSWTTGLRHRSAQWGMPDFGAMMPVSAGGV